MTTDYKERLTWAGDILQTARIKLAKERDRADHGHAIDITQIITMVDAARLICREVVE